MIREQKIIYFFHLEVKRMKQTKSNVRNIKESRQTNDPRACAINRLGTSRDGALLQPQGPKGNLDFGSVSRQIFHFPEFRQLPRNKR